MAIIFVLIPVPHNFPHPITSPTFFIILIKVTSKGFRQNVGAPTGSLDKIIYLFPKYVKY